MSAYPEPERFSFRERPLPVPGDLRIAWRLSLIVLTLGHSRAKQTSLAKLHILNDAIRSKGNAQLLDLIVDAKPGRLPWTFRVEPAFARALNFVVGDKFAVWTSSTNGAALQLTAAWVALFDSLRVEADILVEEQALLALYAKTITEGAVGLVIGSRRREA